MLKKLISLTIAAVGLGVALSAPPAAADEVRIGYQKYGTLVILKE